MSDPPIPDEWRTNWHLAGRVDALGEQGIDVTVAGITLHIRESESGLAAASGGRPYPVMVVDDEIFVLLGDAPD